MDNMLMKISKKISICFLVFVLTVTMTSCGLMSSSNSKDKNTKSEKEYNCQLYITFKNLEVLEERDSIVVYNPEMEKVYDACRPRKAPVDMNFYSKNFRIESNDFPDMCVDVSVDEASVFNVTIDYSTKTIELNKYSMKKDGEYNCQLYITFKNLEVLEERDSILVYNPETKKGYDGCRPRESVVDMNFYSNNFVIKSHDFPEMCVDISVDEASVFIVTIDYSLKTIDVDKQGANN